MNRFIVIAGTAMLTAEVISWAALAWAQPGLDNGMPGSNLPVEAGVADPTPRVDIPGKAGTGGPGIPVSGVIQPLPPATPGTPPIVPGRPPLPPGNAAPSMVPLGPPLQPGPSADAPAGPAPPAPMVLPQMPEMPGKPGPKDGGKPAPMDPGLLGEGPARGPDGAGGTTTPQSGAPQPLVPAQPGATLPPAGGEPETSGAQADSAAGEEHLTESSLTPDNPNGHQEPAISLEWGGPPIAKIGQANSYALVVRNTCNIPLQQVLVRVRIPAGITCSDTEPKVVTEGDLLVWDLGTLQPRQEKSLQMKLVPQHKGDVTPQAWVTFTGSSVLHIKVREPKLTIKAQGPQKVLVGETATFILAVSNPGDGVAEQVKIHAALSEGLENARGPKLDYDIGNLAAGETRNVTVQCIGKIGGEQKCEATAEADGGLQAKDSTTSRITVPRLDLQMVGPGLRYLGRKALYTLKVSNPGDAPASNVIVSDLVPEGFKVLAASDGGRHDFSTRTVSWFLGEIGPGQTHEVKVEVQAINPGDFKHKASAVGSRGLHAESELATHVEGLSALMLEMVDTEDPIELNSEMAYEVRITNTGSKVETDIKLVATVPDKMEFKNATGPVRYHAEGKTIVFEPLVKLAPKADAIFRLNVKALDAGIVRFKIQMTSTNLTEPVIKMEATRIYSDAPEVKSSRE